MNLNIFALERGNLQENCLQDAPPKLFRSRTPKRAPRTDNAQNNCIKKPAIATIERIVFARAVSPSVNILDGLSIQLDLDKS
jgi:hypothetical protein